MCMYMMDIVLPVKRKVQSANTSQNLSMTLPPFNDAATAINRPSKYGINVIDWQCVFESIFDGVKFSGIKSAN